MSLTTYVFGLIFLLGYVNNACGQQTVPNVGDATNNVARLNEMTLISIKPYYFCHLASTNEILGYYENSYEPIYKNTCEGMCLSSIYAPYECREQISYVRVNTYANTYAPSKVIAHVTGCQCGPKRCAVQKLGYTQYVESGGVIYDSCDRKCTCQYGKLVDCCRQRKSFNDLSFAERTRFVNALKTISTQAPYKTQYDTIVNMHQTLFSSGIHGSAVFLPWHRYHILSIENLLQSVDCRVTVPYWDWNAQAANPFGGFPWLGSTDWLGGNGDPSSGGCVTTGPFQVGQWSLPNGACLTRNFNLGATFATVVDVQNLYNTYPSGSASDYNGIRYGLEAGPGMHNTVHCSVGGNMCTTNAAASPEFILHHCNIDRLWANWQSIDFSHVTAYSGDPNAPMPGVGETPSHMFDLNNQPGNVKVCYIRSFRWTWYIDLLATLNVDQVARLPLIPVSPTKRDWPSTAFFNFSTILQNERTRNNLPNVINVSDALSSDSVEQSTGIGLDLANYVGQYDAIGCISQFHSIDINNRCDGE
jgi:tyrosinase